jgi:GTP-binding protein EngB required for normal cell division
MAFSKEEHEKWETLVGQYIEEQRPPERIRDQVDLSYSIEDQSIEIFEIRPRFDNPEEKVREMAAKTTWVKRQQIWKVYWQRADLKWHIYEPVPQVDTLEEFITLVEEDEFACFWG